MRKRPWIMTQDWHDVLFLHWPIAPEEIRGYIPSQLELDLYNNCAWIGLVYYRVEGNRPRLVPPVPGLSSFLGLNVRTYVSYKGKAGIHFFSLDANNPLIVKLTTFGNFLPYRHAKISLKRNKNTFAIHSRYKQRHTFSETLMATFEPIPGHIVSEQFDQWLTERYCLWTKARDRLCRVDISHSPWILQDVTVTILENTMGHFLKSNYQKNNPITHYSKHKKVRFFFPVLEK